MPPELVYCASGNRRFAEIAIGAGFRYGARLPHKVYFPVWFADQDWKKPDRAAYMAALAKHRPHMATVLDWEREEQLPEVLSWAEEVAQYAEYVLIVPKVVSGVTRIPRRIGGRDVVLAYSVPTRYGGSELPLWELADWPVHLLGGSPHRQMQAWHHLVGMANVVSADGNMAMKMATARAQFWVNGTARHAKNRYWPTLQEGGISVEYNAPYAAFMQSCQNIIAAWRAMEGIHVQDANE